MLHTKLINDLDEMRTLAFQPPYALLESIEYAEQRGEAWWVIMGYESHSDHAQWVTGISGGKESQYYSEGNHLSGWWDREHEIFIPNEGLPIDLRGKPVSLSSIIEFEEDETAEEEEKTWQNTRQLARERGLISWGQGDA